MTHPPIKAPFELPQTDTSAEETARRFVADMPADATSTLEAADGIKYVRADTLSHPAAQAGAVQAAPKGMVLVPLVMTRAMQDAVEEEGWEWADLLAAACAVDEREYDIALSHSPGEVDPEQFLDTGLADVQDEGGVLTYYSKSAVLECISAALETAATTPATPSSGMTFEEAKDFASKAIYGAGGRGMNGANRTDLTNRVARAILKASAVAQPASSEKDDRAAIQAKVDRINLSVMRRFTSMWHADAVRLGYDGVTSMLEALAATQPSAAPGDGQGAADEQDAFERKFPIPANCTRYPGGYSIHSFNAWDAQTHCARWEGWKERAALAAPGAAIAAREQEVPRTLRGEVWDDNPDGIVPGQERGPRMNSDTGFYEE